jgi:hypothetical protein
MKPSHNRNDHLIKIKIDISLGDYFFDLVRVPIQDQFALFDVRKGVLDGLEFVPE